MLAIRNLSFDPFERVFDTFNDVASGANWSWQCYSPAADVVETESGYAIALDVPGLTEKDVSVTLEGKHLTISGERKAPEKANFSRQERGFGRFERVFHLPDDVDTGRIEAKAKNGVLTVTLPRAESAKPRTISIATE